MSTQLACIACSLDPQTTSLILPLAQATIIAAPVILRKEIARGVGAIRGRRSKRVSTGTRPPTSSPTVRGPTRR